MTSESVTATTVGDHAAQAVGYSNGNGAAHANPRHASTAISNDRNDWHLSLAATLATAIQQGEHAPGERLTREFEATLIRSALAQTKGRRIEASVWLRWGRNTLTRKIHELGMDGEV